MDFEVKAGQQPVGVYGKPDEFRPYVYGYRSARLNVLGREWYTQVLVPGFDGFYWINTDDLVTLYGLPGLALRGTSHGAG
jgi:hypothetical protein